MMIIIIIIIIIIFTDIKNYLHAPEHFTIETQTTCYFESYGG
jgi:hypothetical protein